ncbi:MAG: squalene/phytoene synthase family protein [Rhodospirillaceae bacterium]|nr:squalene/phytoene synthase family protein [Rhodospirillaceae bacterium]
MAGREMTGRAVAEGESGGNPDASGLIEANSENFPVGSFLIPRECRPHVHAFYVFAREADDIADAPEIAAQEKVARLEAVQRALAIDEAELPGWALAYHHSLIDSGNTPANGRDLLSAFIQDATKTRYRDWDDVIDYCMRSAASVGRVMMDIHGETDSDIEGSDALCCALQMLNHMQDCKKDYLALDRVYLPEPWLVEAGGRVEDLALDRATPAVRQVLDRCLDETEALLRRAESMPRSVRRRGLRLESAFILKLAWALAARLRRQDPVAERVKVSKAGWLVCGLRGVLGAW